MRAVGYPKCGPIDDENALQDITLPEPTPGPRDLLVEVKAVSMNPVDTKVRVLFEPKEGHGILGYDAAGVVTSVGSEVTLFKPGDEVFYAGDITRPGTNSERHLVDERIVGRKPKSLGFAEAAAIPLTAITAWELLFDSFALEKGDGQGDSILIIGGAGGVGSILTQLARKLTSLTVIATASRPETVDWVKKMGAHHVINHREPLVDQIKALGIEPRYVASLTATDQHFPDIIELIKPRGHVAWIDDPESPNVMSGKTKALSFSVEFMFTRSMFQTDDIEKQRALLNRVSDLLDDGTLISTKTGHLGKMSAETLKKAHVLQESGRVIGKNVLDGF